MVGYTEPKGGRPGFGALHLAQYVDGELTYSGSVGTGFSDDMLDEILEMLVDLAGEPGPPMCRHGPQGGRRTIGSSRSS